MEGSQWLLVCDGSAYKPGQCRRDHVTPNAGPARTRSSEAAEIAAKLASGYLALRFGIPRRVAISQLLQIAGLVMCRCLTPLGIAATIVPVPGHGDPVGPEACQRSLSVFDGKIRYDLHLAFKRMEKVKAEQGYEGPVVVCSVSITPIAGYVRGGSAIKYIKEQKDIEVWLAPIANTRMLVPFRISTPTLLGVGMMQATKFIFIPQPPHASTATSMETR